jgi:hypothetical protein
VVARKVEDSLSLTVSLEAEEKQGVNKHAGKFCTMEGSQRTIDHTHHEWLV